jgi:hypothetical protein
MAMKHGDTATCTPEAKQGTDERKYGTDKGEGGIAVREHSGEEHVAQMEKVLSKGYV